MIRDELADAVHGALEALEVDPLPASVEVERTRQREHGDWATNAALKSAKAAGWKPRELAERLAEALNADPPRFVDRVDVAGPGFLNFHLGDGWLHEVLRQVVEEGVGAYARHDRGEGTKVNIEFVSANPTGPIHAGHGRGAAYGDSLARLLERCGYDVSREYYLNDRGTQMELFAESLRARVAGQDVPEGGYQGDYIVEWAKEMPEGVDALEWGEARAVQDHREVLSRMNIEFDTWFSERSLLDSGEILQTLGDLEDRDSIYESDGATWLRSTEHGDDQDRVLVKSDGEYTYLLPDIAYHRNKFGRSFDLLIDVWGADHHGYIARMKAALEFLGHAADDFEVVITQLVNLQRGGEEVRLSKRRGDLIELRDVLDEVGPDAARLTYLLQSVDSAQTFDFDVVKSQAMENPVYYVQYAHARIHSVEREAMERGVERCPLDQADLTLLVHERELDVLRSLSELPEVVLGAAIDRAPHKVTTWVRELARQFHGFYHDCRIMSSPNVDVSDELTQARLWLVEATRVGLLIGLGLLGVAAPERM